MNLVSIERVFTAIIPKVQSKDNSVSTLYLPEPRATIFSVIKNLWYINKSKKEKKASIYHITGNVHYAVFVLPSKSTVLTIHDMNIITGRKGVSRKIAKFFWYTLPMYKAKYITVISHKTYEDLVHLYPRFQHKISVIPNPISSDFEYFPSEFNENVPTILQVGTRENKNLIRVIEALEGIKCKLKIIGKLSDEQENCLKNYKISYEAKYNINDVEIIEEYKKCDIVIFASIYEGFGLPIIEANAIGRPVITSNIEPMISVGSNAAYYCDPYNANDIRRAIKTVISDKNLRKLLITEGLNNAQKYNADNIANMYISLYNKIIISYKD